MQGPAQCPQLAGERANDVGALREPFLVQARRRGLKFGQFLGRHADKPPDKPPQRGGLKAPVTPPLAALHGLNRPERGLDRVAQPLRRAPADAGAFGDPVQRQPGAGALQIDRQSHNVSQLFVAHVGASRVLAVAWRRER